MATHNILHKLQVYAQDLNYEPGNTFSWSAKTQTVTFKPDTLREPAGIWALIHETAHGLLQHKTYSSDFELLQLEVAAWNAPKSSLRSLALRLTKTISKTALIRIVTGCTAAAPAPHAALQASRQIKAPTSAITA